MEPPKEPPSILQIAPSSNYANARLKRAWEASESDDEEKKSRKTTKFIVTDENGNETLLMNSEELENHNQNNKHESFTQIRDEIPSEDEWRELMGHLIFDLPDEETEEAWLDTELIEVSYRAQILPVHDSDVASILEELAQEDDERLRALAEHEEWTMTYGMESSLPDKDEEEEWSYAHWYEGWDTGPVHPWAFEIETGEDKDRDWQAFRHWQAFRDMQMRSPPSPEWYSPPQSSRHMYRRSRTSSPNRSTVVAIPESTKAPLMGLCRECAVLDLEGILLPRPSCSTYEPRTLFSRTRSIASEGGKQCELCALFSTLVSDPEYDGTGIFSFSLYSAASRLELSLSGYDFDAVVLGAHLPYDHPSTSPLSRLGVIAPVRGAFSGSLNLDFRPIDATTIDFRVPKGWISRCQKSHQCGTNRSISNAPFAIRLIDCQTGLVIPADTLYKYTALSYVWGKRKQNLIKGGERLTKRNTSRTIRDAIKATRNLGMRYLWVDRHCIDQYDATEKHTQIGSMHLIYLNARVTLVATSGADDSFGLPGVGARPRKPFPKVTIGDLQVGAALDNPTSLINSSVWSTRGWTYQEALLSRRRLIFTDRELYFECQCARYCESLDSNTEALKDRAPPVDMMKIPAKADNLGIRLRIAEYSKRELSYDLDALNGLSGVLGSYQSLSGRCMRQVCGIPLIPRSGHTLNELFVENLLWDLKGPGRRRDHFPSWCWTGWAGEVGFYDTATETIEVTNVEFEIFVELQNGILTRLNDTRWTQFTTKRTKSDEEPRVLSFATYCQPVRVLSRPDCIVDDGENPYYANLRVQTEGIYGGYEGLGIIDLRAYFKVSLFQEHDTITSSDDVFCILWNPNGTIIDSQDNESKWAPYLPLIRIQNGNGVAERIGTLHFRDVFLCDQIEHEALGTTDHRYSDYWPPVENEIHAAARQPLLNRDGFQKFDAFSLDSRIGFRDKPALKQIRLG